MRSASLIILRHPHIRGQSPQIDDASNLSG